MEIFNIVITGGPCGGKSTAMKWIGETFSKKGYTVLFVPETATELITGGVAPWTCGTNVEYQACQMKLQQTKEAVFWQAASTMPADRVLIVCDRGMMDNKAYMPDEDFVRILGEMELTEQQVLDSYDGVFHLVSAAKGAERHYTTANNAARIETVAEAAALDDRVIAAWQPHPQFCVIDNATDFEGKMHRLIAAIAALLERTV